MTPQEYHSKTADVLIAIFDLDQGNISLDVALGVMIDGIRTGDHDLHLLAAGKLMSIGEPALPRLIAEAIAASAVPDDARLYGRQLVDIIGDIGGPLARTYLIFLREVFRAGEAYTGNMDLSAKTALEFL